MRQIRGRTTTKRAINATTVIAIMMNNGEAQPVLVHTAQTASVPSIVAAVAPIVTEAKQHHTAPEIAEHQQTATVVQQIDESDESKATAPKNDEGNQNQDDGDNGEKPSKKRKTLKKSRILAPRVREPCQ